MNPIKAQRAWNTLSVKWLHATSFGRGVPYRKPKKRKIKKGTLVNLVPVEVVNAITGEVHKGYMRDLSTRRLKKWLELHNHRAQVEQVAIPLKSTIYRLSKKSLQDFPILIKLGDYQVPYLIESFRLDTIINGKWTAVFNLKAVDNLNYLEKVALKKKNVMRLFNKIKKRK